MHIWMFQILDMSDRELEMLAKHMGHDASTHKQYYRLAHSSLELSKVYYKYKIFGHLTWEDDLIVSYDIRLKYGKNLIFGQLFQWELLHLIIYKAIEMES